MLTRATMRVGNDVLMDALRHGKLVDVVYVDY